MYLEEHNCSRIEISEASNSFIYKTQNTKFNSSKDRQHSSSLLFVKHGRYLEQTFIQNLEDNSGYPIERNIYLTAEYIPSLNTRAAD